MKRVVNRKVSRVIECARVQIRQEWKKASLLSFLRGRRAIDG
jgi:hypothetical protein